MKPMKKYASADFFASNRDDIICFGESFLKKLNDREIIDSLAEKDLEKLARIFKLVFDKLDDSESSSENPTVEAIIKALQFSSGG